MASTMSPGFRLCYDMLVASEGFEMLIFISTVKDKVLGILELPPCQPSNWTTLQRQSAIMQ